MKLSSEKGASSWLNALSLQKYGFALTKSEFRDGLALKYGWEPKILPISWACGEPFVMSHALYYAKGGYTDLRYNEIRDTFAKLLGDICNDVEIEPKLQLLEGETFDNKSTSTEDEARLGIKANFSIQDSAEHSAMSKSSTPSLTPVRNKFKKHTNTTKLQGNAISRNTYHKYRKVFSALVCDYRRSPTVRIENHHKTCGQAQRQNFRAIG